jgi:hypothetical protein
MPWTTGLNETAFVFVGWSGLLLFPTAYLAHWWLAYWDNVSLRVGILTGWQVPSYLEGANFPYCSSFYSSRCYGSFSYASLGS